VLSGHCVALWVRNYRAPQSTLVAERDRVFVDAALPHVATMRELKFRRASMKSSERAVMLLLM
jgi:hypothetical protein